MPVPNWNKMNFFLFCNLTFQPLLKDVYLILSNLLILPLETSRRLRHALGLCSHWMKPCSEEAGWGRLMKPAVSQLSQGTKPLTAEKSGPVRVLPFWYRGALGKAFQHLGILLSIRNHGVWFCGRLESQEVNLRAPPLWPSLMNGSMCTCPASPEIPPCV